MKRIVTKKRATAKTQMNVGGYTGEKQSPSIDPFSQMILHVVQVVNLNSGTGSDHAIRPLACENLGDCLRFEGQIYSRAGKLGKTSYAFAM
jgi:hypothetical protein